MPLPFARRARASARESREEASRAAIAELTASRRAIAKAYEIERQRIERDLHDGTQQYLVAALMMLGEAQLSPRLRDDLALAELVSQAKDALAQGLNALRLTVRGLSPQTLRDLGLEAAIREAAATASNRVTVMCPHPLPALPEPVMAAAYFFASEAMTNAAKHAPGTDVSVLLTADRSLHVSVVDAGMGGAVIVEGHGLAGMRERLAAFGGSLALSSPPGGPTHLSARLPLLLEAGESGIVLPRQEDAA